ncbi:uncharacterized protein LOC6559940 [Drosophila grimshawi]|uniref:GH20054 n=1 Tax=Drosophila grimshawi TaxID=7222 RepID=B4J7K3_DROGR|nr:uncharacterized protein LOC6559940 [Drosophila grimshawi]XP_032591011.1 uncharacterized protein LOC6559940 [Drosophila grimshawi]EDW02151.1 GH20054 [Drosophila grimshawi]
MVRRYTTRLKLAKLNQTIESNKSKRVSNSGCDSEPEEEADAEGDQDGSLDDDEKQEFAPPRYVLEMTPHYTHPALNEGLCQRYDPERKLSVFPSCSLTVPLALYVSSQTTSIVEPCYQRPTAHDDWMKQLLSHKCRYLRETGKQKQRELKHKNQVYNTHLFDAAEQIATQDNAYFRDSYDYYYTGGNLNLLQYSTAGNAAKTLAMHVAGERLQQLHLSEVGLEAELWRPLHTESLAGMSSEIFELMPVNSFRVNHGNMLLARLLNDIAIYELKLDDDADEDDDKSSKYELNCQVKYSTQEGPFISVAQAINQPQILAIACQDRSVRFKDIVTEADISKHEVSILMGIHKASTWAQLRASQEHCFHYACQSALLTIDMRCTNEALNPCFASSAYSPQCESFSCLARSQNPNHLYLASNHKLHCLDVRCLGKKLADRAVVTWTHQMSYPPTFMDAIAHDGSEYVAMGCAYPSEQRICELKGALAQSWTEMSSPALPYAPPQLMEALVDGCQHGAGVDVYADLNERVKCCITGLKFDRLEQASDGAFAQLLTANSIGDVMCQRMTQRDDAEEHEERRTGLHANEAISYYASLVKVHARRQLKCTQVGNMSVLRDIMKSDEERNVEQEKPLIIKDVTIDYGFDDSDDDSEEADEADAEEAEEVPKEVEKEVEQEKKQEEKQEEQQQQPTTSQNALQLPTPPPPPPPPEKTSPAPNTQVVKKKAVNRGPWQKSAHQLSRFTDMLSTCLLNIWDIDEFDLTRDVHIDMIDEKLESEKKEAAAEERTAAWLQQMPQPEEQLAASLQEDERKHFVPGTNLPTHFEAQYADYKEVINESVRIDTTTVIKTEDASFNDSLNFTRQPHSTLRPSEFAIIETGRETNPTPAKRRKTKYTMGF